MNTPQINRVDKEDDRIIGNFKGGIKNNNDLTNNTFNKSRNMISSDLTNLNITTVDSKDLRRTDNIVLDNIINESNNNQVQDKFNSNIPDLKKKETILKSSKIYPKKSIINSKFSPAFQSSNNEFMTNNLVSTNSPNLNKKKTIINQTTNNINNNNINTNNNLVPVNLTYYGSPQLGTPNSNLNYNPNSNFNVIVTDIEVQSNPKLELVDSDGKLIPEKTLVMNAGGLVKGGFRNAKDGSTIFGLSKKNNQGEVVNDYQLNLNAKSSTNSVFKIIFDRDKKAYFLSPIQGNQIDEMIIIFVKIEKPFVSSFH